jgi:hypothetical protein
MLKQVLVDSLRRGVALSAFQMATNVMTGAHYNMPLAFIVGLFYLLLRLRIFTYNNIGDS